MELVCISRSHINTPLAVREGLRFAPGEAESFLTSLKQRLELPEVVLVSTCNRIEVYFFGCTYYHLSEVPKQMGLLRGMDPWEPEACETFLGEDAAQHLFSLASGLLSQVKGENEILGQLKDSYQIAHEVKCAGPLTSELFHRAFQVGKQVRTQTSFCSGGTSAGTVAVEHAAAEVGSLADRPALVVGAGDISALAARALSHHHHAPSRLTIANRSRERADIVAAKTGAEVVDLAALPAALAESDSVFTATSATEYVITPEMIPADRTRPLWIYDLAMPRDVDPAVAAHPCVRLRNLDDVNGRISETMALREAEIPKVEEFVRAALTCFQNWRRELAAVPSIQRLLSIGSTTVDDELEPLRDSLPGDEFVVVEQASRRIMKTLMREIIKELKRTAREAGAPTDNTPSR